MTVTAETINFQETEFQQALDELALELPEVAEHRDMIAEGGEELIDSFGIKPELFESKVHVLFFSALAERNAQLEASRADMTITDYTREKEFIGDATALLAYDKSTEYDSFEDQLTTGQKLPDDELEVVYDRFTNKEVTEDLRAAIANGELLADVKEALGTTDDEDPYELHVLNIGNAESPVFAGMDPAFVPHADNEAASARAEQQKAVNEYKAGLHKKTEDFRMQTGSNGEVPPAWVTKIGDKKLLNVPLPIAEKILYPDEIGVAQDDPHRRRDIGVLGHEYVHTQGGLNLDNRIHYGISFEERRAEFLSGDTAGYTDAKALSIDLAVMGAFNIFKALRAEPKGSQYEFFAGMAESVGLQPALELALVAPANYVKGAAPLHANVQHYLGGQDNVIRRIYEARMADPAKAVETQEGLDRWARTTFAEEQQTGVDKTTDWLAYRSHFGNSMFMSQVMGETLDRHRTQAQEVA